MNNSLSTTLMLISFGGLIMAWIGYRKVKKVLDEAKGKQIKDRKKQDEVRRGLTLEIVGSVLAAVLGTIGIIMRF